MEIITGVERRRRWRADEKLRILAELDEPGARFNDVARRHDVSLGLLWQWRDALRRGRLAPDVAAFVPLRIVAELAAPVAPASPAACPTACVDAGGEPDERIEIVLADGTAVRVGERISATALRRILAALRG